jgi:hypothetical protein
MTTIKAAGYIIADGNAIYGTGATQQEALDNANDEGGLNEPNDELSSLHHGISRTMGELYVAPASAALIYMVSTHGGAIAWGDIDGVCVTDAEEQTGEPEHMVRAARGDSGEIIGTATSKEDAIEVCGAVGLTVIPEDNGGNIDFYDAEDGPFTASYEANGMGVWIIECEVAQ